MSSYSAWSVAFSTDCIEQTRIYVSEREWRRIHDEHSDAQRIFGRLMIGDKDVFCPLGEPIGMEQFGNSRNNECIIIPNWAMQILGIDGSGETVEITWLAEDAFPNATRVILRPHDSAFFHGDIKGELERELTTYGVIAEGTTIPVTVSSLDGFSVLMDVIRTFPANIVLLEGDEIEFEFETALDVPAEATAEATAEPTTEATAEAATEAAPVIPEPVIPEATALTHAVVTHPVGAVPAGLVGQRLGGKERPALPDGRPWNPWR